ncbi:FxLYD domain-containing protein [Methanospirillum lacunae]|uniref:Uncharacterized protein n=1 Tax=Methanospirillum lacunae TaxID=668570 RepID=A0A2V2N6E8_9EURY|nr:FxLYD domain-containing protein [Methanospirillum lacunae]PWR74075.1 hypothetical protein DK846_02650 [Methanospirillum lacunae]
MNGHLLPVILSITAICGIAILLFSAVTADYIPLPSFGIPPQNSVPVFDAAQYQTQTSVEKEDVTPGMTMYVQRPYGYIKSTQASQVNLSIIKTDIERISKSTSVIKGEIKNLDEKTIDLIVITFNLYNADGDQIGNAYTSIDYLAPKSTWKFVTDPIERSDFQFEQYGSIYVGVFG